MFLKFRPFVCENCGQGYYRKNILKRHKFECVNTNKEEPDLLQASSSTMVIDQ